MEVRQKGFSLVELMVALTVTLLVAGAVFGLMTGGSNAFQREPQLSDRQQNIRVGLDLLSRDIYRAGYGVPQFAQVFTDDLDGVGEPGPGGEETDEIQIFLASECPPLTVCPISGQAGKSVTTRELLSNCYRLPALVLLGDSAGEWGIRWAEKPGAGASASCEPGSKSGHVVFPPGQAPLVNPTGGFSGWQPDYMLLGQVIRYRVSPGTDGVPNLERSAFGGQDDPDGNSTWEVVARGIEDLQIEYENGAGWQDTPGVIGCVSACVSPGQAQYDTLIRRVRVRLSARTTGGGNLQGQTTSAIGDAVRGQLATEVAPRAAQATLGMFQGES